MLRAGALLGASVLLLAACGGGADMLAKATTLEAEEQAALADAEKARHEMRHPDTGRYVARAVDPIFRRHSGNTLPVVRGE